LDAINDSFLARLHFFNWYSRLSAAPADQHASK
jgi:hypothetical protein